MRRRDAGLRMLAMMGLAFAASATGLGVVKAFQPPPGASDPTPVIQGVQIEIDGVKIDGDLQTILDYGLKTRLPEEKVYTKDIVEMVKQKQLPPELVLSTFHWARKKPKNHVRYFEQALIVRAKTIGIGAPRIANATLPSNVTGTNSSVGP